VLEFSQKQGVCITIHNSSKFLLTHCVSKKNDDILYMLSFLANTSWHHDLFIYGMYLSYILFAITLTGVLYIDPLYLSTLRTIIKYYVCIVLLLRFNPFVKSSNKASDIEFNRRIAFSAGIFLLFTTTATSIMESYLNQVLNINNISTDSHD